MPAIKEIKQRRETIERVRKITYAMQIISQIKLDKVKKGAVWARDYYEKIKQVLFGVVVRSSEIYHPLMQRREKINTIGIILVNSDKGLCGGFNNNVFNQTGNFMQKNSHKHFKFMAIGRKGEKFLHNLQKDLIIKRFFDIKKEQLYQICREICKNVIDLYINKELDEIYLIYNEYKLNLLGKATRLKILPIEPELSLKEGEILTDYLYEPSAPAVLAALLPEYIFELIFYAVLESNASEELARMFAMKMATDNADEIIEDLKLSYNKARQTLITTEIIEIINAAQPVKV